MATLGQELQAYEDEQLYGSAEKRFKEVSDRTLGGRRLAFTQAAQLPMQRAEGGVGFPVSSGGIVRGTDLNRRAAAQAQLAGKYGQMMGNQVGVALGEEADALARYRSQADAAKAAFEQAQGQTAAAAFGLAGETTSMVTGAIQRVARAEKNRRGAEFKQAYNELLAAGIGPTEAFAQAREFSAYDPTTGEFLRPIGAK
tara:strand:+ start:21 stop:617 length:597 start_codon:yes stop_codon:yes gene_type:complete